jgi:hypothetical protein
MAKKISEFQLKILHDLNESEDLHDNFWSCYLGYKQAINALIRKGLAKRPYHGAPDALVMTQRGYEVYNWGHKV